jgi:hypothetical protein
MKPVMFMEKETLIVDVMNITVKCILLKHVRELFSALNEEQHEYSICKYRNTAIY